MEINHPVYDVGLHSQSTWLFFIDFWVASFLGCSEVLNLTGEPKNGTNSMTDGISGKISFENIANHQNTSLHPVQS